MPHLVVLSECEEQAKEMVVTTSSKKSNGQEQKNKHTSDTNATECKNSSNESKFCINYNNLYSILFRFRFFHMYAACWSNSSGSRTFFWAANRFKASNFRCRDSISSLIRWLSSWKTKKPRKQVLVEIERAWARARRPGSPPIQGS